MRTKIAKLRIYRLLRALDLPEVEATAVLVDDDQSTIATKNTATAIYCSPSDMIHKQFSNVETAVGLRLTGGKATLDFEDGNLLLISPTTSQQQ